jgi:(2Fe-2S) ferredoxin
MLPTVALIEEVELTVVLVYVEVHPIRFATTIYVPAHKLDGFITVEVYPEGPVHENVDPANVDVVIEPVHEPQVVGEGVKETTGTGLTVTVEIAVEEHAPADPVTV